jgi:hypothetical protein
VLDRLTQELDVWLGDFPVALAAPRLDQGEMTATVRALREVLGCGVAKKAVISVAPPLVEQAVPLIEAALADGPDIDIELVPAEVPRRLLDGSWLAVAPRDSSWQEGAPAVWNIELAPARNA